MRKALWLLDLWILDFYWIFSIDLPIIYGRIRVPKGEKKMLATKREMVERVAEKVGVTGMQARQIVQATLDDLVQTLAATGRIELRNFGVFTVKVRAARKARNPRSGETVMIGERKVVKFKPGKVMESAIQSQV